MIRLLEAAFDLLTPFIAPRCISRTVLLDSMILLFLLNACSGSIL